ncbi:MAG: clostripain-related cysteine peptidase [Elusimicrobiaceae bacterium]|nr:clostripain-related cysteine peptidase [Elusimicrobiaceae bacterium]
MRFKSAIIFSAIATLALSPAIAKKLPAAAQQLHKPAGIRVAWPKTAPVAIDSGITMSLPQPEREWTVMAFVNGKNDLAFQAFTAVNAMESAAPGADVNIVLELGMVNDKELRFKRLRSWRGIRRFFVTSDSDPRKITSIPLPGEPYGDMGSYRHLVRFCKWAKTNFPAKKYMLIMISHGDGMYYISPDNLTRNAIGLTELGKALARIGGVDVFAADACLMQMAEVAYVLKDAVKVMVGSEAIMPYLGFDYTANINLLRANPGMGAEEAGTVIVETFAKLYAGKAGKGGIGYNGKRTTLSALRLSEMDNLAVSVKTWTEAVRNSPDSIRCLRVALRKARRFDEPEFLDLHHFGDLVMRNTSDPVLQSASASLLTLLKDRLLVINKQRRFKQANGLSIYVPTGTTLRRGYRESAFAQQSGWYLFLCWLKRNNLLREDMPNPAKWVE